MEGVPLEPVVLVRRNRARSSDQVFPDWAPPPADEEQRRANQARNQDHQGNQDIARGRPIIRNPQLVEIAAAPRRARTEDREAPFSRSFNRMAAAAHALANNQDQELTRSVTRDLVNDTRDGRAKNLLKYEIGEALLSTNKEDLLQTLPDLDPNLANSTGADKDILKQVDKAIANLPPKDRELKEGSNWLPLLSLVTSWANRHNLSFDQIRDILARQVTRVLWNE